MKVKEVKVINVNGENVEVEIEREEYTAVRMVKGVLHDIKDLPGDIMKFILKHPIVYMIVAVPTIAVYQELIKQLMDGNVNIEG